MKFLFHVIAHNIVSFVGLLNNYLFNGSLKDKIGPSLPALRSLLFLVQHVIDQTTRALTMR